MITNYLNKICKVEGKYYEWNDQMKKLEGKTGHEYGVIAQEIEKEFPELVRVEDDGYMTVDYIQFIPIIIESIKELKKELDSLKKEINKE